MTMPTTPERPRAARSRTAPLAAAALCSLSIAPAFAQADAPKSIEACAAVGAPTDRLACYDKLAGRAPEPATPPARDALPGGSASPPTTSLLAAKGAALPDGTAPASLLSKYWELEPEDKRGIFNFVGFQPNYVLPLHVTNRINRTPTSPTQATVSLPDYRREEAKFQLSLRTKLAQDLLLPNADLWVGFTQQTFWQIWNGKDSKPFRNSDYQPEAIYVIPTAKAWRELPLGWQWRYTQLGLAHQSNGQSDPLSRSWNRVYAAAGFERGDWSLTGRFTQRLNEPLATDNNPDLVTYRGRGEFQLGWVNGLQTVSLLYRSTPSNVKYGALQFEWTYPVARAQPNGLRWYVQAFSGYGETLTDYNFRQTSLGLGVTFLQF
jgi:phospholipase A1